LANRFLALAAGIKALRMTEEAWIRQALAGDREAFGRLVEAYQQPVYNLTYRLLGDVEESRDAAQETFLRAYYWLHTYDPSRKFSSWLLSIATHHCIDCLRRRRFTRISVDAPELLTMANDQPQPEAIILAQERQDEIQRLLNNLEPGQRAVIVLRYWHDCSYEEIAAVMNITESAVKSRLHRARCNLARLFEGKSLGPPLDKTGESG